MTDFSIPDAIRKLLDIVEQLARAHEPKKFTLDGRLVGDIGEVLVKEAYDLELLEGLQKHHDARAADGRLVQIKATMKTQLTFPCDHTPDFYIGVQIHRDGTFTEVFNGPGSVARQAIANRARPKNNLHCVSISALRKLQSQVPASLRIAMRPNYSLKRTDQSLRD